MSFFSDADTLYAFHIEVVVTSKFLLVAKKGHTSTVSRQFNCEKMSTAVVPESSLKSGASGFNLAANQGAIRAATFAKKLKAKTQKKDHSTRTMFIAMIPLFILIGLAAFVLHLLEIDTERESALAFEAQTASLEASVAELNDRVTRTLDLGNLDRIHAPVEKIEDIEDEEGTKTKQTTIANSADNTTFFWNATLNYLHCYTNGTQQDRTYIVETITATNQIIRTVKKMESVRFTPVLCLFFCLFSCG